VKEYGVQDTFKSLGLEYRESRRHPGLWLWPSEDIWAWKWLNKIGHWDLPVQIARLCGRKNLVVQAGGNAGLYPKQYSQLFQSVVTLEPDYRNFTCLCCNVTEENVVKYQAAVGDVESSIELETNPRWNETNTGALKIKGHGDIKQITIDSLNLDPDLIHLDIEGFEAFALLGAQATIARSKPLIVLETNGSGDEYGWPQEKIDILLRSWNYEIHVAWDHDTVYKYAG
jgi:FkbM family methyltransferase